MDLFHYHEYGNQTQNLTSDIGGIAYLLINLSTYLPYIVLYSVGIFVGVLGNSLTIATIVVTKELHNITNMFIFNLSIADLIISGFVGSFAVIGKKR
jgi:hypothetical protein